MVSICLSLFLMTLDRDPRDILKYDKYETNDLSYHNNNIHYPLFCYYDYCYFHRYSLAFGEDLNLSNNHHNKFIATTTTTTICILSVFHIHDCRICFRKWSNISWTGLVVFQQKIIFLPPKDKILI